MPYYTKLYQTDLPHRAKLVYLYLHDRMDNERKAWPGIKTIAEDLSISLEAPSSEPLKIWKKLPSYEKSCTIGKTVAVLFPQSGFLCDFKNPA